MSYKITLSPIASKNIEDALEYYVLKAGKTVASNFLKEFHRVYSDLQKNPFYQYHDNKYRFVPFKKFPYIVFFIIDENTKTVYINAVFNTSQDPNKLK